MISSAAQGKPNISIRFIRVSQYFDSEKLFVDQHLSVETYYRLIIPEIMPDYHKILYLDCDMVANCDVAELYDIDLGGSILGAAKDIDVAGQMNLGRNNWKEYASGTVGLGNPYGYFQAGVLILDLNRLRNTASSEEMIRIALARRWRCHDQDVLNHICKGQIKYVSQEWNVLMDWQEPGRSRMEILKMAPRMLYEEYVDARKAPKMVHYAGYQKPWDVVGCDMAEYFWEYAKLSPYYPRLLRGIKRCLAEEDGGIATGIEKLEQDAGIRRIANRLLPFGSRRRELLKNLYFRKNRN